jgi:hypothetical protein
LVTFNCGGPATIDISTGTGTKTIAADTTIDGAGLITISGGDSVGVFGVNSGQDLLLPRARRLHLSTPPVRVVALGKNLRGAQPARGGGDPAARYAPCSRSVVWSLGCY